MKLYRETQPWGFTDYEIQEGSYTSFQTPIQKVELITNARFGRMLFLDGILQSTTSDEDIYHKALVNAGMANSPKSILIAGGAEGAVAREVLKHSSVKFVKMVDWDADLVDHCYSVEKFNTSALEDARLSYSNKNILNYCDETMRRFDTAFVDLLDINTEEELYQMQTILSSISKICVKGKSVIVVNVGRNKNFAKNLFPDKIKDSDIIEMNIPSFQEPWYLVKYVY